MARLGLALVMWVSVWGGGGALPADPPAEPVDGRHDPRGVAVLDAAAAALRTPAGFRVTMGQTLAIQAQGMGFNVSDTHDIVFRQPDRLRYELKEGWTGFTVVADGQAVHTLSPMFNAYTREEVSGDSGPAPGVLGRIPLVGPLLQALVDPPALVELFADTLSSQYDGREVVDDRECHRIRLERFGGDWTIWVEAGEQPLLRQVKMVRAGMTSEAEGALGLTATVQFTDWRTDGLPELDAFAFTPPAGARVVESFGNLLPQLPASPPADGPVDQAAPGFRLELLEGGEVDLGRHVGREVVVLDFWATWCAPCRRALPVLADVAVAFADRGVVCYAVAVGEPADKVRAGLAHLGLAGRLSVPLDRDGVVSKAYGVKGIPHLVVIGRDGRVRGVHTGFGPGDRARLEQELTALVNEAGPDRP